MVTSLKTRRSSFESRPGQQEQTVVPLQGAAKPHCVGSVKAAYAQLAFANHAIVISRVFHHKQRITATQKVIKDMTCSKTSKLTSYKNAKRTQEFLEANAEQ